MLRGARHIRQHSGPIISWGSAALRVPVVIRSFGLDCRKPGHPPVVGSEMAHRIGCARITRERKGLAAAAAEVKLTTWAACARLLHPSGAPEGIEGGRISPRCQRATTRARSRTRAR